jgi:hypothetical protein
MASEQPTAPREWIVPPIGADHIEKRSLLGAGPNHDERAHGLVKIARDYPGWHAWPGTLAGVVYARRPRTSPPLVVRAATPDQLRRAIEDAERERGLR